MVQKVGDLAPKVVFVEVESALVPPGATEPSAEVVQAVADWQAQGGILVPVTSLSLTEIGPLARELGLKGYGVVDDGATTFGFGEGRRDPDLSYWLPPSTQRRIIDLASFNWAGVSFGPDEAFCDKVTNLHDIDRAVPMLRAAYRANHELLVRAALAPLVAEGLIQLRVTEHPDGDDEHIMHITHKRATKPDGVRNLLDDVYWNVPPSNILMIGSAAFAALGPKGVQRVVVDESAPDKTFVAALEKHTEQQPVLYWWA